MEKGGKKGGWEAVFPFYFLSNFTPTSEMPGRMSRFIA
jgi:hypothetical protein